MVVVINRAFWDIPYGIWVNLHIGSNWLYTQVDTYEKKTLEAILAFGL
jgi:hypothetical protein